MTKNRYVVFAHCDYYPSGGWGDFVSAHSDLGAAEKATDVAQESYDAAYVIDLETFEEVYRGTLYS